jgi:hypothetical protein
MNRALVAYGAAAALVRLADEGARLGVVLLGVSGPGGARAGALYAAALLAPHVLAAPVLGRIVDRSGRPGRVTALAAAGFGTGLALAAAADDRLPAVAVAGLLVLTGACGPAITGALTSQLGALVPAAGLPRAFGLDALTWNVAGIAGPAVVAVLAAAADPATALLVLAGIALAGAVFIAALPIGAGLPRTGLDSHGRGGRLDGLRAVFGQPALAAVTTATVVGQLGAGALPVVVTVAAGRWHEAAAAGWIFTAAAVGGMAGSLAWTWRPARARVAPLVVLVGVALTGVVTAAAAVSSSLVVIAGLLALSAAVNGPVFGALLTVRQTRTRPELQAQVFSIGAGLKMTATALGSAAAGAVAAATTGVQFLVVGALPIIGALLGAALLRRGQPPAASTASDNAGQPVLAHSSKSRSANATRPRPASGSIQSMVPV